MRWLALVTARGGSKGFPGKNLALLAGRPLVNWAFQAITAIPAGDDEIIPFLSTDDPAIAAAWPEAHRPARLRPAHLASDIASSLDVVLHELSALAAEGRPCSGVLLVQPTSPLVKTADLMALLAAGRGGSAILGAPAPHPPQWALTCDNAGILHELTPGAESMRRQDLPAAVLPVGVYACTAEFLRQHRAFTVPGRTRGVVIPAVRSVDIDHRSDLAVAAALLAETNRPQPFQLGDRLVGAGRCLVIAEAGVNHNGRLDLALELIDAAAAAGADVVKFQTFSADALVTADARKAAYQVANTGDGGNQHAMLKALELTAEQFAACKQRCSDRGVVFLSSPFDPVSAQLLADLGVAGFKLGSGELTNWPLVHQVAGYGKPVILSSGMADLSEAEAGVSWVRASGNHQVAILHCVSTYPAPPESCNLRAMDSLAVATGAVIGWSDHTLGEAITLAAVARGAAIIEKHLTIDRRLPGPDHAASLEPEEFARLVVNIRAVEAALGDGVKVPAACEADTAAVARKSIVAARDLPAGKVLTAHDLAVKRPGDGLPPRLLPSLLGRKLHRAVRADERLSKGDVA